MTSAEEKPHSWGTINYVSDFNTWANTAAKIDEVLILTYQVIIITN